MREINIKLFRNEELHDWSMEINGRFHEHISNDGLTDLVGGALIIAAKSLIQSAGLTVEHSKASAWGYCCRAGIRRYPDSLTLVRIVKDFGLPAQQLWDEARKQSPVSRAVPRHPAIYFASSVRHFFGNAIATTLETRLTERTHVSIAGKGSEGYALFIVDPTANVTDWNRGAERPLGFVESESAGRNLSCIFNAEDIQNHLPESQLYKALNAGRAEDEGWHVRGNLVLRLYTAVKDYLRHAAMPHQPRWCQGVKCL